MKMDLLKLSILATVCMLATGDDHISRVGNTLRPSASGVDAAGATFLISDHVFGDGVLFAYSAYFRTDKPVKFQVWRPTAAGLEFTLLTETRVIPSLTYDREDVYIESRLTERCLRVRQGDRLGVHMEEAPGAVAYTFDPDTPTALGNTLTNLSLPHLPGNTVTFGALTFPYDFSVAAYVDLETAEYNFTGASGDFVDCRHGLFIPADADLEPLPGQTTTPSPTGRPGATGDAGPRGNAGPTGARGPAGSAGSAGGTGATGPAGPVGLPGVAGLSGATGQSGGRGEEGATGPRGEKGEAGQQGPRGLPGPPGAPALSPGPPAPVTALDQLRTPWLALSLLIWLSLVTLALLAALVCLCRLLRRPDNFRRRRMPSESTDASKPGSGSGSAAGSWKGDMKDVSSKDFYNDTITLPFPDITLRVEHESSTPKYPYTTSTLPKYATDYPYTTSTITRHKNDYERRQSGKINPKYLSDPDCDVDVDDIYPTM